MPPEVMTAMTEANEFFVDMVELNDAAGKRAAELLGAEAAMVTCGGFSGLILGAAACLTGTDREKAEALPHPTWAKHECLIQTAQKFSYDRAYRAAGASVVYATTRDELVSAINEKTAMIAGLSNVERQGVFAPPIDARRAPPPSPELIKPEDLIAIGKKAGVPVLIDMASDMPPWDNLQRFLKAGADLVVLSGGKTIGGPQATGLLLGRRDLIDAARLNASPNDNIGRGMKVGKEEIVGLIVALERFVKQDHLAETERWAARARRVADGLQGIPGPHGGGRAQHVAVRGCRAHVGSGGDSDGPNRVRRKAREWESAHSARAERAGARHAALARDGADAASPRWRGVARGAAIARDLRGARLERRGRLGCIAPSCGHTIGYGHKRP